MKFSTFILTAWLLLLDHSWGQERMIELSSRAGPMICELEFYNQEGDKIGSPLPIVGTKFFWHAVPPEAAKFALKTATILSEKVGLKNEHTYVRVLELPDPRQPKTTGFKLEAENRKRFVPQEPRDEGWVYLGKKDTSGGSWSTLYVKGEDPQGQRTLKSFPEFERKVNSSTTEPTLVVNFPLNWREQLGKQGTAPIIRAGQKVTVKELKEQSGRVYAKVKVSEE